MATREWEKDVPDKLFMFSGFSSTDKIAERDEIIKRIKALNGDVDLSATWNEKCTHVVACNFNFYSEKVLIGLASGKWVVTPRYVAKSFKNSAWCSPKPFICDDSVLLLREKYFATGGIFSQLKVIFLMESALRHKVYSAVVKAGGGQVFDDWGIEELLQFKPAPSELNCIVADPHILSSTDRRHQQFQEWKSYAGQVWDAKCGDTLHYIYYKYFYESLIVPGSAPCLASFSLYNPRVLELARRNGDLNPPTKSTPATKDDSVNKRLIEVEREPICKKQRTELSTPVATQRTQLSTAVMTPNVIDLSDDSDDDIEILEQKLNREMSSQRRMGPNGQPAGRIYYDSSRQNGSGIPEILLDTSVEVLSLSSDSEVEDDDKDIFFICPSAEDKNSHDLKKSSVQVVSFNEEISNREEGAEAEAKNSRVKVVATSETDSGLEIVASSPKTSTSSIPLRKQASKRSSLFKEKLKMLQEMESKREEGSADGERTVTIDRTDSTESAGEIPAESERTKTVCRTESTESTESDNISEEPVQEVIRPEIEEIEDTVDLIKELTLEEPDFQQLNQILSTLLERQLATDECIEIAHATPRTARFDKNKENVLAGKMRLTPVGSDVVEEFQNKQSDMQDEDVEPKPRRIVRSSKKSRGDDDNDSDDDDTDDDDDVHIPTDNFFTNEWPKLGNLEYLNSATNFFTHPTSSILNVIMSKYLFKQTSSYLARKSYMYLDKFIFLHLGRDASERERWSNLVLSAFRDCGEMFQYETFDKENSQDIHSCWTFFSKILKDVGNQISSKSDLMESSRTMVAFIVKLTTKDFELWWKHCRKTEHKDKRVVTYPLLFYLLEGRKGNELIENMSSSILRLFKVLMKHNEDLTDIRKLVSMCAMLVAYQDFQDKDGLLLRGMKKAFASKVEQVLAKSNLSSDDLYIELYLLKPSWLSWLVSKRHLYRQKNIEINNLSDLSTQFNLMTSSNDLDLTAPLSNLANKMVATLHIHTILRTHWLLHTSSLQDQVFAHITRLQPLPHRSNILKLKSDVVVKKSQIVENCNHLRLFCHSESKVEDASSVLASLLFKMSSSLKF